METSEPVELLDPATANDAEGETRVDAFEGATLPAWLEQDLTLDDIRAIVQGGCSSGAYMAAVTYHQALATMSEYGDAVFDYLEESQGEIPTPPEVQSWSGLACFYLSCAVEIWASSMLETLKLKEW